MTELETILEQVRRKYQVETVPLRVGGKVVKVLQIEDFEAYLAELIETRDAGPDDLPYWAKLWDASLLLAYFIGKQPVVPWRRMLEIGAGVGVVGVYASLCGHKVAISDSNDDALLFARANVLMNGSKAEVKKLDWNSSLSGERFEVIFASEFTCERESYPRVVSFLRRALAPNGTIFLARSKSLHTPVFFEELTKYFKFKQTDRTVRSGDEKLEISLYAVKFKD